MLLANCQWQVKKLSTIFIQLKNEEVHPTRNEKYRELEQLEINTSRFLCFRNVQKHLETR